MLNILSKTSTLTLTYDHVIWKVIENIFSLRATTVPSFKTPRQRGQQILTGHYLNKDKHIDLDLRPFDPKITGEHLLSGGNHTVSSLGTIEKYESE